MNVSVTQPYLNAGENGGLKQEVHWHWRFDEAVVKLLVAASVTDTVSDRIKRGTSTNNVWEELKTIF